jgi:hypothetical protein
VTVTAADTESAVVAAEQRDFPTPVVGATETAIINSVETTRRPLNTRRSVTVGTDIIYRPDSDSDIIYRPDISLTGADNE